jgi:glutathione S-transferase
LITLCGMAISNYYNKAKLALLEKGVPFEEQYVATGSKDEAVLSCSPLGKAPFIKTEHGALSESQAILDYIEAVYPTPPLLPTDPWAAAKVRELTIYIDLHLELVVRQLYGEAFFGARVDDDTKARVRKQLPRNIEAFKRLARFAPFVAGANFTQADCSAYASLPLIGMATKAIYGEDLMAAAGVDLKPYTRMLGERPSAQRVVADRKAEQAAYKKS